MRGLLSNAPRSEYSEYTPDFAYRARVAGQTVRANPVSQGAAGARWRRFAHILLSEHQLGRRNVAKRDAPGGLGRRQFLGNAGTLVLGGLSRNLLAQTPPTAGAGTQD